MFADMDLFGHIEFSVPNKVYPVCGINALHIHDLLSMEGLLIEVVDHALHLGLGQVGKDPEVLKELHFLINLSLHSIACDHLVVSLIQNCKICIFIAKYGG